GQYGVARADELRDLGLEGDEDRGQPAIDEIGGAGKLDIEPLQERDGVLRVEPVVADDPLVDGEQAQRAAMGIDAHRGEVMDGSVGAARPYEAVEMPVLHGTFLGRMAMVEPLRARRGIEDVAG